MALIYTEFEVDNVSFHIFTLPDRRPTAGSSRPVKWLYQMDVESFLYNHGDDSRTTGAFYRLLQRTPGAAGRALCLRKASVGQGLITDADWEALREPFQSSLRVLTLVPVDVAAKAIAVFGETDRSAALIKALGYDRPSEWEQGEDEVGEEEGEEGEGRANEGARGVTMTTRAAATRGSTAATAATAGPASPPRSSSSTTRKLTHSGSCIVVGKCCSRSAFFRTVPCDSSCPKKTYPRV